MKKQYFLLLTLIGVLIFPLRSFASLIFPIPVQCDNPCTSYLYSEWNECSSMGTKNREIIGSYPYECGVSVTESRDIFGAPYCSNAITPATTESCIPACTKIIYSDWGNECINNIQQRIVENYIPDNCEGGVKGDEILTQGCVPCTGRIYSNWSDCVNNQQERVILYNTPSECVGEPSEEPDIYQSCNDDIVCNNWSYSDWDGCVDNQQSRTIITSYPEDCISGEPFLIRICENDLDKKDTSLSNRLKGKLLLQVNQGGRIWYVDFDGKRWEVTWKNLMTLFESLALGITDEDLNKIDTGEL
jgi:hypothetical protein